MKFSSIILVLATALSAVSTYDVDCNSTYQVSEDDHCLGLLDKNEISLSRFNALNPSVDCENLVPGSKVCVNGQTKFSSVKAFKETDSIVEETNNMIVNNNYNNEFAANDMASILSMPIDQANQFLEIANEAKSYYDDAYLFSVDASLTVDQCKAECSKAQENFEALLQKSVNIFSIEKYNLYLRSTGQKEISNDGLLELCKNNCYIIKEVNDYVKNNENNGMNENSTTNYSENTLQKRDNVCENINKARFNIQYNYKNGFNRYTQAPGSAETHLSRVNGCSIPVLQNVYDKDNAGLFVPACNTHDMCYGCQMGKDYCDSRFLDNMNLICNSVKSDTSCFTLAKAFYTAVKVGGQSHYDRHRVHQTSPNCAYCGAPVIRNQLLLVPFYK